MEYFESIGYAPGFNSLDPPNGREDQWTCSWWEQSVALLKRSLRERKHESYSGLRIFQTMSISIVSCCNGCDQASETFKIRLDSSSSSPSSRVFSLYLPPSSNSQKRTGTHKRTCLQHVPSLFLLLGSSSRRHPNGAAATGHVRNCTLLDEWPEIFNTHIYSNPLDRSSQRSRHSWARPHTWSHSDGCKIGYGYGYG